MDIAIEKLQESLRLIQDMKTRFDAVIAASPQGSLTYQKRGDKLQLIHCYRENGQTVRRGINRDIDAQKALAQKAFAMQASSVLTSNLDILENALSQITAFSPAQILKEMSNAYASLPEAYFFDRNKLSEVLHLPEEDRAKILRHREWGKKDYQASAYHPEWKKHKTSRGLKMRSKSEVLIMERLYHYGIDVRYEQEWNVGCETIAPDFTFEDQDGKLFWWEHLGMMDDPGYAARNYNKLNKYYNHGIILGKNLIVSFDRSGTIDMKLIDFTIRNEVIPRL